MHTIVLYFVLYVALHMAAMVGNASMTDLLIRRGAVVNGTDYHGSTPLHISCQKGHQSVAVSTHTFDFILFVLTLLMLRLLLSKTQGRKDF